MNLTRSFRPGITLYHKFQADIAFKAFGILIFFSLDCRLKLQANVTEERLKCEDLSFSAFMIFFLIKAEFSMPYNLHYKRYKNE